MNFYTLLEQRYSLRSFQKNRPVERPILERILNAGRMAPSAKNLQPWKFKLISTPALLEAVCSSYPADWLRSAPHILIVTGRRDQAWVRRQDGYNSLETDLTIAMDHMILAASYEGIATCWIAAFDPAILRPALDLDPQEEVFAITPLGYAAPEAEGRPKSRKSLEEVAEFI